MIRWIFVVVTATGAIMILRKQWKDLRMSSQRAREAWREFRRDSAD